MSRGPSTLQVRGLSRSHLEGRAWRRVLHGVDLRVTIGESLAILGRSGCGKTTLLRALTLLDRPGPADTGEIALDGAPVRRAGTRALRPYRRAVQYVPQDPAASLDPRRPVLAQVARPLATLGVAGAREDHEAMAADILESLELPRDLWSRRPHEISGGQAQRVALARALAPRPRFLLLDEPVSGLDPSLRRQVLDLLVTAEALHGVDRPGIVLVSHDLAAVARVCERCLVMDQGVVVEDAPTGMLLEAPTHPAARALRDAVPHMPAPA